MGADGATGASVDFVYDIDAWRAQKKVNGQPTVFYLRGATGQLLTEWTNATPNAQVRDYIYAGGRLRARTDAAKVQPPQASSA